MMYTRFAFALTFAIKRPFLSQIIRLFSGFYTFLPPPPPDVRHPPRPRSFPKFFFIFFRICALYFCKFLRVLLFLGFLFRFARFAAFRHYGLSTAVFLCVRWIMPPMVFRGRVRRFSRTFGGSCCSVACLRVFAVNCAFVVP